MSTSVCAICGGVEGDHANSQHIFTLNPGELITREQKDKEEPPQRVTIPRTAEGPMGRLLEVLTVKGYIDLAEVLYVADLAGRPDSLKGESNGNGS